MKTNEYIWLKGKKVNRYNLMEEKIIIKWMYKSKKIIEEINE